jgi:glycosidase
MPGSPCIYYGTEIAMEGGHDPDCRRCMPWDSIDAGEFRDRMGIIKSLIHLRREEPLLRNRNFHFPNRINRPRVIEFLKVEWTDKYVEIIINCEEEDIEVPREGRVLFERHYIDNVLLKNGILIRKIGD